HHALTGKNAAIAVGQGGFRPGDLTLTRPIAELPDALDDGVQAIHARMSARQAAAVSVDGKRAPHSNPSVLNEPGTLALGAKAEILQEQNGIDGESVIQFDHVDIGWSQPR